MCLNSLQIYLYLQLVGIIQKLDGLSSNFSFLAFCKDYIGPIPHLISYDSSKENKGS